MKKFIKFLYVIVGLLDFIFVALGIDDVLQFLKIDSYIFKYILIIFCTLGFILMLSKELSEREEIEKVELLKKAKKIYTLNYKNLEYIKGIELDPYNQFKCTIILRDDSHLTLGDREIPEDQEMLLSLDKELKLLNK